MAKANKGVVLAGDGEVAIEYLPLSEVERWPRNPKGHDVPSIMQSMQRFGFIAPLLRDAATGRIVAGHGRLEALTRLAKGGDPPPKRIKTDDAGAWYVPVLTGVGFESEAEAEAYLIADNNLVTLGGWDETEMADMLGDLDTAGVDLFTGLGYDEASLREAIAAATVTSDFAKPEVVDTHGISPSAGGSHAKKDGNWFYAEFTGEDERYRKLRDGLLAAGAMVPKVPHEILPDPFATMIDLYLAKLRGGTGQA